MEAATWAKQVKW